MLAKREENLPKQVVSCVPKLSIHLSAAHPSDNPGMQPLGYKLHQFMLIPFAASVASQVEAPATLLWKAPCCVWFGESQ